jgi:hypothetical protein
MSVLSSPYISNSTGGMMPLAGLIVQPFPEPGHEVRASMEALQFYSTNPPESEEELRRLAEMPRPWDPAGCSGRLREEMWQWLDQVAIWINQQHLWNVARPGIPECWPAHPHLAHDLAVVASARYYTSFAVNPSALDDWHRYCLPTFLERLRDRLGDGCQPGKHMPRPRTERDDMHADTKTRRGRLQRYRDDVDHAAEAAAARPSAGAQG